MDSKEYQRRVLETESKPTVINFGTLGTHAVLGLITKTADIVDQVKKKMFYNSPKFDIAQVAADCRALADIASCIAEWADAGILIDAADIEHIDVPDNLRSLNLENINKRLLHVVLGVNSETGEKSDALRAAWEANVPVDRVNFAEEVGDGLWYLAVGADELGIPFDTLFEQNITKLQDKKNGRYKQGSFDVDGATNRNLAAERGLLEGSLAGRDPSPTPVLVKPLAEALAGVSPLANVSPVAEALATIKSALVADKGYAIGWHCNLAQAFAAEGLEYQAAQRGAGRFMVLLFDTDTSRFPEFVACHNQKPGVVDTLKQAAVATLDAVDKGVDKAKDYLTK